MKVLSAGTESFTHASSVLKMKVADAESAKAALAGPSFGAFPIEVLLVMLACSLNAVCQKCGLNAEVDNCSCSFNGKSRQEDESRDAEHHGPCRGVVGELLAGDDCQIKGQNKRDEERVFLGLHNQVMCPRDWPLKNDILLGPIEMGVPVTAQNIGRRNTDRHDHATDPDSRSVCCVGV